MKKNNKTISDIKRKFLDFQRGFCTKISENPLSFTIHISFTIYFTINYLYTVKLRLFYLILKCKGMFYTSKNLLKRDTPFSLG